MAATSPPSAPPRIWISMSIGAPPEVRVEDLYQDWAREHAATLSDKDDPTLQCRPTAFGTLNVRLFDVGTLGQIVATPDLVVFLQETFHGYQLIPTDGREHRDYIPPSYRGDSVGHWEGDTFVVDTRNFTEDTWLYAEGRVSFHSDALRITTIPSRPIQRGSTVMKM